MQKEKSVDKRNFFIPHCKTFGAAINPLSAMNEYREYCFNLIQILKQQIKKTEWWKQQRKLEKITEYHNEKTILKGFWFVTGIIIAILVKK